MHASFLPLQQLVSVHIHQYQGCTCSMHGPSDQTVGPSVSFTIETNGLLLSEWTILTSGSRVGACPTHAPLQDPILSFLHTFSPKSTHVAGPRHLTGPYFPREILDPPLILFQRINQIVRNKYDSRMVRF